MDKERRVALTAQYPKLKCVRCGKWSSESGCRKQLEPLTCSREFDPGDGNQAVPA